MAASRTGILVCSILAVCAYLTFPNSAMAKRVLVTVNEGTELAVQRTPDSATLLLDLQGSIWSMPMSGGSARRLTPDLMEMIKSHLSPDGQWLAVQAYVGGVWNVWRISINGQRRERMTSGLTDATNPRWSRDGRMLAYIATDDDRSALRIRQLATREESEFALASGVHDIEWTSDGRSIIAAAPTGLIRFALDKPAQPETLETHCPTGTLPVAPSVSPSGQRLAYICSGPQMGKLMLTESSGAHRQLDEFADVSTSPVTWAAEDRLIFAADGKIRDWDLQTGQSKTIPMSVRFSLERPSYRRKSFDFDGVLPIKVKGIVAPALAPDGRRFVFKALNDLWVADSSGVATQLTNDAAFETDPAWSSDGSQLLFASDRSGTMQLHIMDLISKAVRQITSSSDAATAPAWSRDGKRIAYQTQSGDLRVLDLATGTAAVLVPPQDMPGRPSWSHDGRHIAFAASNAGRNRIALADSETGALRWIDAAPMRSVSTRGDDGPVWSPDGRRLLYSMMSQLWMLPVASDGTPTGKPRRVFSNVTDAPSWAADSRTILLLSNGRPVIVDRITGRHRTVPLRIERKPLRGQKVMIIHAGRLWDGLSPDVRMDMDIVVRNNRVESVAPHRDHEPGVGVIDATGLTVTPGLIEMHNHQQLRSRYWGDRQGRLWLSFGITTTRSTGDPAYRALEDKESLDTGARLGPRHFMTGEMLEGSRQLWSFSRPIENEAQLLRELKRADKLGYDLIKTYMRFRSDWQVRVANWAHRGPGIPVTSHFIFPGVAHGVDGTEHLVGPTRWGMLFFPHMFKGNVYADILDIVAAAKMPMTTTNFASRAGLLELPGIAHDHRIERLMPAWEIADMKHKMGCAAGIEPCDFFLAPHDEQAALSARDQIRIARGGGQIMIGTDAPLDTPAVSLFHNMYALQKAGFSPFETLQAATLVSARALGVERHLGGIAAGKVADMVFVRGKPDRDIRDLMNVDGVMRDGIYRRVDEILAGSPPSTFSGH